MPLKQLELLEQLEQLKQSHQLKHNQLKQLEKLKQLEELKQTAMCNLHVYKEATSGGDANEEKAVNIATKLLTASGMKYVEQRYKW